MNRDFRVGEEQTNGSKWFGIVALFLLAGLTCYLLVRKIESEDSLLVIVREDTHSYQQVPAPPGDFRSDANGDNVKEQEFLAENILRIPITESLLDLAKSNNVEGFRSLVKANLSTSLIGKHENTLVVFVSASGVVDSDGSPVLLTGDFELPSPGPINAADPGVLSVSSLCSLIAGADCEHKLLVLDSGHSVFDPRLGILGNDFPRQVAAIDHAERSGVWILCSNDSHQLNQIDLFSKRSVFGDAFANGILGHADEEDKDGRITLRELYSYVYRRCTQRSQGMMMPLLIGPKGVVDVTTAQDLKEQVLAEDDFYISMSTVDEADSATNDKLLPENEGPDDADVGRDSGEVEPVVHSGDWKDLLESWEEIELVEKRDDEEWLLFDYAPALVKSQAQKLIYAQTELLSGKPLREVFQDTNLDESLVNTRRRQILESLDSLSAKYIWRRRLAYRSIYQTFEFALLDARLSTFGDKSTTKITDKLSNHVQTLVENFSLPTTNRRDEWFTSTDQTSDNLNEAFQSLDGVCSYAISERRMGILRCLIESPVLPISQRRNVCAILSQKTDSTQAKLNETGFFSSEKATRAPDYSNARTLLSKLPTARDITLDDYPKLAAFIDNKSGDQESLAGKAYLARIVDGRDCIENGAWSSDLLYPQENAETVNPAIKSKPNFVRFSRISEEQTVELQLDEITEKVLIEVEHPYLKLEYPETQLDPWETDVPIKLKLVAKEYSLEESTAAISVRSSKGTSLATLNLLILPLKKGSVEILVVDKAEPGNSLANRERCIVLRPFPNRDTKFEFRLEHSYSAAKSFRLTVFSVPRPAEATWPLFALRDLNSDELEKLTRQPKTELGTWEATNVPAGREVEFVKQKIEANASERKDETSESSSGIALTQCLVFEVVDTDTEAKERIWVDFDLRSPTDYVSVEKSANSRSFKIVAEVNKQITVPGFFENVIPLRLHGREAGESFDLFPQKMRDEATIDVGDSDQVALDIDGYPRARRWPPRPEFTVRSIAYGEGDQAVTQKVIDGESILLKGDASGELALDLQFDFGSFDTSGNWQYIEAGFDGEAPQKFFSDRDQSMNAVFAENLALTVTSKVQDCRAVLRLRNETRKKLQIYEVSGTSKTLHFSTEIEFDNEPPTDITIRPPSIQAQKPEDIEFTVTGNERNPDKMTASVRKSTIDDSAKWLPVASETFRGRDSFAARIDLSGNERVKELELGKKYDLKVEVTDKVGNTREKEFPAAVTLLPPPPVEKKKAPAPKAPKPKTLPPKPEDLPPKGRVTIHPVLVTSSFPAENIKVEKDGVEIETEGQGTEFYFDVDAPGEFKVKLRGLRNGKQHTGERVLLIATQKDVKAYDVTMKEFKRK